MLWFVETWVSLAQGTFGPGFYGGLVCGLSKIVGSDNFLARFVGGKEL